MPLSRSVPFPGDHPTALFGGEPKRRSDCRFLKCGCSIKLVGCRVELLVSSAMVLLVEIICSRAVCHKGWVRMPVGTSRCTYLCTCSVLPEGHPLPCHC